MMDENVSWYQFHVNPEPWAVGPISSGRRNGHIVPIVGKNQQMESYKAAIREELETRYPKEQSYILPPRYSLDFFFWRRLDTASTGTPGRRQHQADGTNMMKATEDALQDILIGNDRDVLHGAWTIVSQGPNVTPGVVLRIHWGLNPLESVRILPEELQQEIMGYRHLTLLEDDNPVSDNAWPPR